MNCVSWAESFAFCIWDGGFLPTEVQWEYAAAGGIENRKYPWGASEPTSEEATFGGTKGVLIPVGSHPKGRGRWGHHDLAGSRWEWTLDFFRVDWYASWTSGSVCVDCANLANADYQVFRGGGWASTAEESRVTFRAGGPTSFSYRADDIGVRCARAKAR